MVISSAREDGVIITIRPVAGISGTVYRHRLAHEWSADDAFDIPARSCVNEGTGEPLESCGLTS